MSKRLLVVTTRARSLWNFRGALLTQLARAGFHVVAAAAEVSASDRRTLSAQYGVELEVVRSLRSQQIAPGADIAAIAELARIVRRVRPDLVFSYTPKPILLSGLVARALSVPYVPMFTGLGRALGGLHGYLPPPGQGAIRAFRFALYGCHAVIVQNADDAEALTRAGIAGPSSIFKVPGSGVDLSHFAPSSVGSAAHLLFLGRFMREKGICEFLRAVETLRTLRAQEHFVATAVGSGAEADGDYWARWGRRVQVGMPGFVEDVRPYLRASTVVVLPSYYPEGQPRALLEGLATGRALVAADAPGTRDPVRHGLNGVLVAPKSAAALTSALINLMRQPELVQRMGEESRRIAVSDYDAEIVAQQLVRIIEAARAESC